MFIDENKFIYKDALLDQADTFAEEFKKINVFLQYPNDIHTMKKGSKGERPAFKHEQAAHAEEYERKDRKLVEQGGIGVQNKGQSEQYKKEGEEGYEIDTSEDKSRPGWNKWLKEGKTRRSFDHANAPKTTKVESMADGVSVRVHNNKWDLSPFLYKGKWLNGHPSKKILNFLKQLDHIFIASFSILKPGAIVYPHTGYKLKDGSPVFRVHVPVIIPEDYKKCWLRVEKEKKSWKKGELLIFNDLCEHEAQNMTDETRVVMLMDFRREAFNF